jgi:hypothetical protein
LLVEVEVVILKYGSHLHFLKYSVRRRKEAHKRARSLTSWEEWGGMKGT